MNDITKRAVVALAVAGAALFLSGSANAVGPAVDEQDQLLLTVTQETTDAIGQQRQYIITSETPEGPGP
ncbi:hypothetical protein ACFXB3_22640 [Streptomyces sp. NPDC059447]|uniref:hypothetical protein n=1 Tax=Streptomyces sp. NPDC059447 TaxID=3346834 RepID=UPI003695CB0D